MIISYGVELFRHQQDKIYINLSVPYFGRYHEIMDRRAMIKQETLQQRRKENLGVIACH